MNSFHSFSEIEEFVVGSGIKKRIALAGAHDSYALDSVIHARKKGLVEAVLIGHEEEIRSLLKERGENEADYHLVNCENDPEAAEIAVRMVHEGEADMPMKGLLHTSDFMRPILNKKTGLLPPGNLLSQSTLVEDRKEHRLFQITDCAINIAPNLDQKRKMIENAVALAGCLGVELPKVAVVSALEEVNEKIPSTVDAASLANECREGKIKGCVVEGPFGFDNAVSREAAKHKGMKSQVAGQADIIVVPDLCSGNILTKSIIFFTNMPSCGTLLGTSVPVIAVSRTDTPENKYRGILVSLLFAIREETK